MNAVIIHESRGRIRLRLKQKNLSLRQADLLEAWFKKQTWVQQATVHERTQCLILHYTGSRDQVLQNLKGLTWEQMESLTLLSHSSRVLNRAFEEKLVGKVAMKIFGTLFLPPPFRIARVLLHTLPFLRRGLRCLFNRKIKVELLDAISIGISVFRKDFATAGSVMFLLELGELLEEWTRKKSVQDLAQCMSLNVDRVWLSTPDGEILTPISQIQPGDQVIVRIGGIVPVDGVVSQGEAMVNQASLTGESIPVAKRPGSFVYAGTTVAEGECTILVKQISGQSRYDQIVAMIEHSEQLKSKMCIRDSDNTVKITVHMQGRINKGRQKNAVDHLRPLPRRVVNMGGIDI